jgi:transposase
MQEVFLYCIERESLVRDRTKTVNQVHGFLLEFGIGLPVGKAVITRLPATLAEHLLPPRLAAILERLHAHFKCLDEQTRSLANTSKFAAATAPVHGTVPQPRCLIFAIPVELPRPAPSTRRCGLRNPVSEET